VTNRHPAGTRIGGTEVSWEETYRQRLSCPCGQGQVEEIGFSDDWSRLRVDRRMLCRSCAKSYVYSDEVIHGHPGNEVVRGWVKRRTTDIAPSRLAQKRPSE
jgi:hypothetical protein